MGVVTWFFTNLIHFSKGMHVEINKFEIGAVTQVVEGDAESKIQELTDLQLAIVGGGSGDVVFH